MCAIGNCSWGRDEPMPAVLPWRHPRGHDTPHRPGMAGQGPQGRIAGFLCAYAGSSRGLPQTLRPQNRRLVRATFGHVRDLRLTEHSQRSRCNILIANNFIKGAYGAHPTFDTAGDGISSQGPVIKLSILQDSCNCQANMTLFKALTLIPSPLGSSMEAVQSPIRSIGAPKTGG